MIAAESFADRVVSRIGRRLSVYPGHDPSAALTGVEVLAILSAIVAACDQLNPGWRDQALGLIGRLLPPWGRSAREARRVEAQGKQIRERARRALDPENAGLLNRSQARRDRAILVNATRSRVQSLRDDSPASLPPENVVADAILEETLMADDSQIDHAIADLLPR